jgi:hypothetical protein
MLIDHEHEDKGTDLWAHCQIQSGDLTLIKLVFQVPRNRDAIHEARRTTALFATPLFKKIQ